MLLLLMLLLALLSLSTDRTILMMIQHRRTKTAPIAALYSICLSIPITVVLLLLLLVAADVSSLSLDRIFSMVFRNLMKSILPRPVTGSYVCLFHHYSDYACISYHHTTLHACQNGIEINVWWDEGRVVPENVVSYLLSYIVWIWLI